MNATAQAITYHYPLDLAALAQRAKDLDMEGGAAGVIEAAMYGTLLSFQSPRTHNALMFYVRENGALCGIEDSMQVERRRVHRFFDILIPASLRALLLQAHQLFAVGVLDEARAQRNLARIEASIGLAKEQCQGGGITSLNAALLSEEGPLPEVPPPAAVSPNSPLN